MTDPVDKKHLDESQKHWVDANKMAQRDPDPRGALVQLMCEILWYYTEGHGVLNDDLRKTVEQRCKAVGLNPLHVWNAVVALARTLPRKNGPQPNPKEE